MILKEIKDLMDNLAKDDMVSSNEQEFQFEFALRLKKLKNVVSVKLESLSLSGYEKWLTVESDINSKEKIKIDKEYTDILVTETNGSKTAIELKYKTPERVCIYNTKNGFTVTMSQGASDDGCYLFLKDIQRLEHIDERLFQSEKIAVSNRFAIMLTNDNNYRFNSFKRRKIWHNYAINEKRGIIPAGLLYFNTNDTRHGGYESIELSQQISLENWNNYPLSNPTYNDYNNNKSHNPGFSYLIVEV